MRIKFQDPPLRGDDWQEVAEELEARPGEWALILEDARSASKAGGLRKFGCQITTRKNEDGTFEVYARYIAPSTNGNGIRRKPRA